MRVTPELIASIWPLHRVSIGSPFTTHRDRHVLTIATDEGGYVLKVDLSGRGDARRSAVVIDQLARGGFQHVPALLATRTGSYVADLLGGEAVMLELIPLPVAPEPLSPETWAEFGEVAARLNEQTRCTEPYGVPVDEALDEIEVWGSSRPFAREIPSLVARLRRELAGGSPQGMVHGEMNEANARRRSEGEIVLVDWDEAGVGPVSIETGYPLLTVFVDEVSLEVHGDAAAAFYGAYHGAGGILDPERIFAAALMHALRHLRYGAPEARWRRILAALEMEDELRSLIPSS